MTGTGRHHGGRHDQPTAADAGTSRAARPPARPGSAARKWHCRCGNLLGLLDGGWLFTQRRQRIITSHLPARVQCEKCGHPQTEMPQDAGGAADGETTAAD